MTSHTGLNPLAMLAAIVVVGAGGCLTAPRPSAIIWVADSAANDVPPAPTAFEAQDPTILPRKLRLAGAINETLGFCFALRPDGIPLERPHLVVEPPTGSKGRLDASALSIFRMRRVDGAEALPGWHIRSVTPDRRVQHPLDVLVPIGAPKGGLPDPLIPGRTYYFWVDLTIPKGTSAGSYAGTITLTSQDRPVSSLDIRLTVWPFLLPDSAAFPAIVELDHRGLFRHHVALGGFPFELSQDNWQDSPQRSRLDDLLLGTMRLLQSHRLTPVLADLTPIAGIGAHGRLEVNWEQYDAIAAPCISGEAYFNRLPTRAWPMPVGRFVKPLMGNTGSVAPDSAKLLTAFLVECAKHFEEKGWLDIAYAAAPGDGRPGIAAARAARDFARLVGEVAPEVAILSRLFPQDIAPYGWVDFPRLELRDAIDIWMPRAQFFDPSAMARQRQRGRRTWLAVDRPPFSGSVALHASPADVRVLAWQSLELGAQALHVGSANRWPTETDRHSPADCLAVDRSVLLYPGGPFGLDTPVASVRLKHLRRGMQDAAYAKLLGIHNLTHIVDTLRRALAPDTGSLAYRTHFADGRTTAWCEDQATFDAAREIMAAALLDKLRGGRGESRSDLFAKNAQWRRFMLGTRKLQPAVEGVRLHWTGGPKSLTARIECSVTLVNRKRTPVGGVIRFGQLPPGWTVSDGVIEVPPIAPGRSLRIILTANASRPATDAAGIADLPLEFADERGALYCFAGRLAHLTAVPISMPVTVDGDLRDWPAGVTNVAADFVLITGIEADPSSDRPTRPYEPTTAFVMRDDEYLYIGVNCELSSPLVPEEQRRKAVYYDDLIPMGEELIEILIDPLNAGTRSPTDLFHIVVKPSGTDLCERGIRFDPPCGRREPWPVDIEVATRVTPNRWVVELAVPLAAFGEGAAENHSWGFNITRFDRLHQEFSTWSGARGNAYDPLSLGNLSLH